MDEIDSKLLPSSVLMDSSVLIPALSAASKGGDAASGALFDALIQNKRRILIAAPTAAEFFRRAPTTSIPRTEFVLVVPFDAQAAEELGKRFPPEILKTYRVGNVRLDYIKYDAMIVACAVRHRAGVIVSTDKQQRALAAAVGLSVAAPKDYLAKQLPMKFSNPPEPTRPPDPKRSKPGPP